MTNTIQFWLSFNNGQERLRLPVNPQSIGVTTDFEYSDVDVAQLGTYTVVGNRGLSEVAFSTFFPRDYNPTYCEYESFPRPWEIIETIERWRDERKPMKLTITDTSVNMSVTLRKFDYDAERAGNVGDIYVDFRFKEYRDVILSEVRAISSVSATNTPNEQRPDNRQKSRIYTVNKGDWLIKIAKKELNDSSRWREIYDLNRSKIGNDPNTIQPGQSLRLPSS